MRVSSLPPLTLVHCEHQKFPLLHHSHGPRRGAHLILLPSCNPIPVPILGVKLHRTFIFPKGSSNVGVIDYKSSLQIFQLHKMYQKKGMSFICNLRNAQALPCYIFLTHFLTRILQAMWKSRNKSEKTPKRWTSRKQPMPVPWQWTMEDLEHTNGKRGDGCCCLGAGLPPLAGAPTAIPQGFKIPCVKNWDPLVAKVLNTELKKKKKNLPWLDRKYWNG